MDDTKISGELVQLRSDVLYLIRVIEKLETKIAKIEKSIEQTVRKQPNDQMLGMKIEKL